MTTEEKAKAYDEALKRAEAAINIAADKDLVKGVATTIFPELRESEDERIRKVIYKLLLGMREEIFTSQDEIVTKEKVLAWLEKQKEQKPVEWNDADMREARDNLITVCRDWERGELTTLLPIVATRARYFLEHLIEPQKPAEWSEEDERIRKAILGFLNPDKGGTKYSSNAGLVEWSNWLKSLRPQPKQEWSEEDKNGMFSDIIMAIRAFYKCEREDLVDYVKSLSPVKKEWNEKDELMRNRCIADLGYLTEYEPQYKERYDAQIDWLKSLRPQPHWKPTKNQLDALNFVIMDYTEDGCVATANYLQEISAEIKKL